MCKPWIPCNFTSSVTSPSGNYCRHTQSGSVKCKTVKLWNCRLQHSLQLVYFNFQRILLIQSHLLAWVKYLAFYFVLCAIHFSVSFFLSRARFYYILLPLFGKFKMQYNKKNGFLVMVRSQFYIRMCLRVSRSPSVSSSLKENERVREGERVHWVKRSKVLMQ